MFNNNTNKKKSSSLKVNTHPTGNNLPSINMISDGTKVNGTLNTQSDIRIAGEFEGEIKAKGKIIISSTGKINGDVDAVDADIAGHLKGEIHVSNKLILRQSALVDGDIYTKSLLVEEGAQINGACRMSESVSDRPKSSGLIKDGLKSEAKETSKA